MLAVMCFTSKEERFGFVLWSVTVFAAVSWYLCMQMLWTGSQLQNRTLATATALELAYLVFTERLCCNINARRAWGSIAWVFGVTNDENASLSAPRLFKLLDRGQAISEGCG